MYEEVRSKQGRLLFRWDAESNAVEVVSKGKREVVHLKPLKMPYRKKCSEDQLPSGEP